MGWSVAVLCIKYDGAVDMLVKEVYVSLVLMFIHVSCVHIILDNYLISPSFRVGRHFYSNNISHLTIRPGTSCVTRSRQTKFYSSFCTCMPPSDSVRDADRFATKKKYSNKNKSNVASRA